MSDGATTMRAWRVHKWGEPLDVLQLDDVPVPEPGPGELLVRVQGIPLNLNDLERINGGNMMVIPELPCCPGMEVMGTVEACGAGADEWQGKRVVATTKGATGGYAELAICPTPAAFVMPDDIPFPDAAALYFPFHLAWLGLFDRAGLQAGESVLVHAAAGGAGSAAIQLAVDAGATVFATAGTEEKLQLCRDLGARVRDQLPRQRLRRSGDGRDRQPRRRRRVRQRRCRGARPVVQVHRLQRPVPDDGLRVRQDQGRRALHRAATRRGGELQALRRAPRRTPRPRSARS